MAFALLDYDARVDADVIRHVGEHKLRTGTWVEGSFTEEDVGKIFTASGKIASYEPPLDKAKEVRQSGLKFECAYAITGGFRSSALGEERTYGSQSTDQANLTHDVSAGLATKIWCSDADGKWSREEHTADQAKQVLADFVAARSAAQDKLVELQERLAKATSTSDVQAIVW